MKKNWFNKVTIVLIILAITIIFIGVKRDKDNQHNLEFDSEIIYKIRRWIS